jgi:hypothetical protein
MLFGSFGLVSIEVMEIGVCEGKKPLGIVYIVAYSRQILSLDYKHSVFWFIFTQACRSRCHADWLNGPIH